MPGSPQRSLLVQAVRYENEDLQMPPSGKLKANEISLLEKWIAMGAPWPDRCDSREDDSHHVLARLVCDPNEIVFHGKNQVQQIRVIAEWADGKREEVTCLCRFQTNDDAVVSIDQNGLAQSTGEGDSHVIAFYDNGVMAIPVLRPFGVATVADSSRRTANDVDRFINEKLKKLNVQPSARCTDAEFLRRVSIDMTGTLPTPDEVVQFINDPDTEKRRRKIVVSIPDSAFDQLL